MLKYPHVSQQANINRQQAKMAFPFSSHKPQRGKEFGSADLGTNIRLRLRCPFRLLSFGYVLKDALRLTQPKRAALPFDETRNLMA